MKVVIRAGGNGVRLWPLSRQSRPKQFLPLFGGKTLFAMAVERARMLVEDPRDLFVSCDVRFEEVVKKLAPDVLPTNIIRETVRKNTGPALCLETIIMQSRALGHEAVISMPADDYIENPDAWVTALTEAAAFVQENPAWVYTPCALVNEIEPGFSYVRGGEELVQLSHGPMLAVAEWKEKPSRSEAVAYVNNGFSAHTGTYIYTPEGFSLVWRELREEVYRVCEQYAFAQEGSEELFCGLPSETVETMITRHIPSVAMSSIPDLGWSDVGRWSSVRRILGTNGNYLKGTVALHDSHNLLVSVPQKQVVILGLSDATVIDTGDTLFIATDDALPLLKSAVDGLSSVLQ